MLKDGDEVDKGLTIIGCGPGSADLMTIRGKRADEVADVVVGSRRLLSAARSTLRMSCPVRMPVSARISCRSSPWQPSS